MTRVRAQMTSRAARPADALRAIGDALSDADIALSDALASERPLVDSHDATLLRLASRVLEAMSHLADDDTGLRPAAVLEGQLRFLENAVLEGEATYRIDAHQARGPLDRAAHALMLLDDASRPSSADTLALVTASAEVAALLVRAAANLETSGTAQHAAAEGSATLSAAVSALVRETAVVSRALPASRHADEARDTIGRHLCECLRVPVDLSALDALGRDAKGFRRALDAARTSWLALAAREYAAASALAARVPAPEYEPRHGSLANAVTASTVNVLREARLLLRPGAFRHRRAWGRQGIALSYALEAYINGLNDNHDALAQAQLMVLTRLSRSVAALALIDTQKHNARAATRR
jgi:hypothetical protein